MTDYDLQNRMEELYQKQQQCLRIQKRLGIAATVLCVFGVFPLFADALIGIFWGGYLSNKATWLAKKRYPYALLGPGYGRQGLSFDRNLRTVASRLGDEMTVKILEFNRYTVMYSLAGGMGYVISLIVVSILLRMVGMDLSGFLP